MACDLRLGEHTAQMYVSTDIASSGHVTHKNGHIKAVSVSVGSYIGSLGSIPKGADDLLIVFLFFF